MLRYVLLLALAVMSLSCASGSGRSSSDVMMTVYDENNMPRCEWEDVGRVHLGTPAWATTSDRRAASQEYREQIKRMGGDAVIYVDPPKEYIAIKFIDPGCME
jgi:hypothetical protein